MHGSRYVNLTSTFDGMTRLDGMLDPEGGAALRAALFPLTQRLGPDDDRTPPQRRADALTTLATAAMSFDDLLPTFNGERPAITATLDYHQLTAELHAHAQQRDDGSFTIGGVPISPATARQLACDADILPVVLGGDSEVLDIGRAMPNAALGLPHPPPEILVLRRPHQQNQRRPPLPIPPLARPQPKLDHQPKPHRQDRSRPHLNPVVIRFGVRRVSQDRGWFTGA
jgi:hypothetical protein